MAENGNGEARTAVDAAPERHIALEDPLNSETSAVRDGRRPPRPLAHAVPGRRALASHPGGPRHRAVAPHRDGPRPAQHDGARGRAVPLDSVPVAFSTCRSSNRRWTRGSTGLVPGKLGERYEELARFGAPQIAAAIEIIADPASHPVVFHCTAARTAPVSCAAVTWLSSVCRRDGHRRLRAERPRHHRPADRWRARNPEAGRELDEYPRPSRRRRRTSRGSSSASVTSTDRSRGTPSRPASAQTC